jgi:hypothetical protein
MTDRKTETTETTDLNKINKKMPQDYYNPKA